ncbi:uncharacterized protein LOC134813347 [Bolinopsis microptera]|uniref:uncharacterized protein LOC134813347 n=1 Tax=Bolinopsis microptera TaxID=2820187 RepID=UPI00307ABEE3
MPKMRARYIKWPLSLLISLVSLLICTANGSDSNDVVRLMQTMEENCDGKEACVNENIDRLINSLSKGRTVDREIGSDDLSNMIYLMKLVDNKCGADLICLDHLYDTFRDQIADTGGSLAKNYLEDESENIDEINYLGVGFDIDEKYYDMMVLSAKFEDEIETILGAQQKELKEERKKSREERREMYKRMSDEEKKQWREDRKQNRKKNKKERQEKRKQKRGERNGRKEARRDKKEDRQTNKEERREKKENRQIEREKRRQNRKDKMED